MAKILIVTYSGFGNWFSLRLLEEGHSVDIYYCGKSGEPCTKVLSGLIEPPLTGKPVFSNYDLILFDLTGKPKLAEEAIEATQGKVIGDGNFNSEIEDDRLIGIQIMEDCGINVPPYDAFDDINEARRFIRKTNRRYVFKPNGGQDQDTASTYVSESSDDLLKYLDKLSTTSKGVEFILQEVVQGTEVSTEAWFNGEDFFLINSTLEEKKFMNDGHGPNTGCSGNLVWVYDEMNPPLIFREGLGLMKDFLKEYKYKGMIDLNTIVSDREIYGLEWTPRFGYDATATLFNLISSNIGDFLLAIAEGRSPTYEIGNGFAAGVRLSIPPYPSEIRGKHPENVPITGIDPDDCLNNCYLYDVGLGEDDELTTMGVNGLIGVVIESGSTIEVAFGKVNERIKKIKIPNLQYRTDIEKRVRDRYKILSNQGWLR
jgi:phosphoribosylamine---glycine ligase